MANITREEILKLARISCISVHESEIDGLIKSLESVLNYAQCLQEIALKAVDVEPLPKNCNQMRSDVVQATDPSLLLAQAPEQADHYFVVPVILKQ